MATYYPTIGATCITMAVAGALVQYYFVLPAPWPPWVSLGVIALFLVGFVLVVNWRWIVDNYFFDNAEYKPNASRLALVRRLRFRAMLMHNFSVAVLAVSVVVIFGGLYLFAHLPPATSDGGYAALINGSVGLVLLIFLVQVLFRVFKYLLRVGSFYHGIADVLELHKIVAYEEAGAKEPGKALPEGVTPPPPTTVDLDKLFERLVPSAYDMSDVESANLLSTLKELVKK